MRFAVVLCLLILGATSPAKSASLSGAKAESLIAEIYKGLSGYKASTEDREKVSKAGGDPTYGEILPKAVSNLIAYLNIQGDDVFYDLGSGNGKVAMQIYLSTAIKKSVGIELSDHRHGQAVKAKSRAKKQGLLSPDRSLQYIHGNILKTDFSDATIVYLCSTCYTAEMMDVLLKKVTRLKKGTKVVTLKEFSKNNKLKLITWLILSMTWSKDSIIHIYEVV